MDGERSRFDAAIARFDAANAEDPRRDASGGTELPRELLYARRMTERLLQLAPDASEVVQLAARSQHIRRWTIPRERFSMDRAGYRAWRTALGAFHAETAAGILREVGYDEATAARVGALLRKERLKVDAEVQLLEDVACLVFLEHYFVEFARGQTEEKLVEIVRKTWRKMSSAGHAAAMSLDLSEDAARIVRRALGPD